MKQAQVVSMQKSIRFKDAQIVGHAVVIVMDFVLAGNVLRFMEEWNKVFILLW